MDCKFCALAIAAKVVIWVDLICELRETDSLGKIFQMFGGFEWKWALYTVQAEDIMQPSHHDILQCLKHELIRAREVKCRAISKDLHLFPLCIGQIPHEHHHPHTTNQLLTMMTFKMVDSLWSFLRGSVCIESLPSSLLHKSRQGSAAKFVLSCDVKYK